MTLFYQGKYFEKFEELIKYSKEWRDFPLDHETAERLVDDLKKEIIMNAFLCSEFTNSEFQDYLQNVFELAMKELRNQQQKEK